MADLPGDIGRLTVTGQMVLGIADSNDAGSSPDQVSAIASVVFTPVFPSSDPLVAVSDDMLVAAQEITCTLRSDGKLVPPGDGVSSAPDPAATPAVQLIAPNQPLSLNFTGWDWMMKVSPAGGQTWRPFTKYFSGAPGDSLSMAQIVAASAAPTAGVLSAMVYDAATTAEPYPDGFRPGIDLLLTPDGKLWSIDL